MREEGYRLRLIELPDIVLEAILFNLTYDEIAKNRVVRDLLPTAFSSLSRSFRCTYSRCVFSERESYYYCVLSVICLLYALLYYSVEK